MGGGIAYQAASKGTPIIMKDIGNPQLALGMTEANKLLTKQVERKKMKPAQMGETLARIRPTLSYEEFKEVDIVIEAVTENPRIKEAVLADTENRYVRIRLLHPILLQFRLRAWQKPYSVRKTLLVCTSLTRYT